MDKRSRQSRIARGSSSRELAQEVIRILVKFDQSNRKALDQEEKAVPPHLRPMGGKKHAAPCINVSDHSFPEPCGPKARAKGLAMISLKIRPETARHR